MNLPDNGMKLIVGKMEQSHQDDVRNETLEHSENDLKRIDLDDSLKDKKNLRIDSILVEMKVMVSKGSKHKENLQETKI